jgi:hypothetical protein
MSDSDQIEVTFRLTRGDIARSDEERAAGIADQLTMISALDLD